ncbi:MAG: hypothetical protein CL902_05740, partial [Dehalococcoidia bacterium]|nr:hypothetical protein [Dehalococcoidia bacterium]
MSDAELEMDNSPQSDTRPAPRRWNNDLGGFDFAGRLLEFDKVREQLVSHTHTVVGAERSRALAPTRDLLDIATRQQ